MLLSTTETWNESVYVRVWKSEDKISFSSLLMSTKRLSFQNQSRPACIVMHKGISFLFLRKWKSNWSNSFRYLIKRKKVTNVWGTVFHEFLLTANIVNKRNTCNPFPKVNTPLIKPLSSSSLVHYPLLLNSIDIIASLIVSQSLFGSTPLNLYHLKEIFQNIMH